jgi:hypothetical protein
MQFPCAILLSVACPALQRFSALSHIRHDLRKIVIERKMCFDFLCNFCLKQCSFFKKKKSAIYYHTYACLNLKYSDFNETLTLFKRFSRNTQTSNFIKLRPVTAELLHADGQLAITLPVRRLPSAPPRRRGWEIRKISSFMNRYVILKIKTLRSFKTSATVQQPTHLGKYLAVARL